MRLLPAAPTVAALLLTALLLTALLLAALLLGTAHALATDPPAALAPAATTAAGQTHAPRHVTAIRGTRTQGFHVTWSDGGEWWTPTRSESLAECGEYDRAVRRVECEATVRTRHQWMGIVKRSLHRQP